MARAIGFIGIVAAQFGRDITALAKGFLQGEHIGIHLDKRGGRI